MGNRTRLRLALAWAGFLVCWVIVAYLALIVTGMGPCGGDGGSPNASPASPAGRYCDAIEGYLESGEPGEVTTALVYLWPVALLVGLGALSVWRRSRRLLVGVATVATAVLVVHVGLAYNLRDRCQPDDASRPGCEHY